jgi:hypothetical protein
VAIDIEGQIGAEIPASSIFTSLAESSSFFEAGSLGYSVTREPQRLDGLKLATKEWHVEPLHLATAYSSYFSNPAKFPTGSVEFDHALIMRNVAHEWHTADDLYV